MPHDERGERIENPLGPNCDYGDACWAEWTMAMCLFVSCERLILCSPTIIRGRSDAMNDAPHALLPDVKSGSLVKYYALWWSLFITQREPSSPTIYNGGQCDWGTKNWWRLLFFVQLVLSYTVLVIGTVWQAIIIFEHTKWKYTTKALSDLNLSV